MTSIGRIWFILAYCHSYWQNIQPIKSVLPFCSALPIQYTQLIGFTTVEATREALNRHQLRRYTRLALAVWACNLPTSASPWRSRIRKHKIAQFGLALRGSQILSRVASGLWHVQCTVQSALPPVTAFLSSVGRIVGPCRYLSRPCFYWRHVYCLHSHTSLINRFLFVYRNSIGILIIANLVIDKEAYLRRIRKLYSVWEVSCMEFRLSNGLPEYHRPNVSGPKTPQTKYFGPWNYHRPHFVHFLVPQTIWVRPKSHHRPNA